VLRRHYVSILASAALALAVWLLVLWQPVRQVRRHTERLLAAVEGKDWKRFAEFMADDYSDQWGHDKTAVVERSREVFAQFFLIETGAHDLAVEESDGIGTAHAHLVLRGSGGPLAQIAIERVAALREPFVFLWRQRSWKPWDWALTRVEQPELALGEY
jgi:ketosteroid isomerase-like protein